ncbi:TIGR01621 family pseudouridine synthase [Marinomonas sp. C1424]|uniref:TIGR01621 family pseudouridine synthase n=1 Tax=Marinomonas transparens TaxID=2795388 RepID=A0A934JQ19_9GAMM|nr:TIGR01621 family pseudouridine synthase [Marinomonas transparens]
MLSVLFRCDDFWVIRKSPGMSFHADSDELGVMQSLALSYPQQRFFPVHRLDKMTSGLLVVACHAKAAAQFGVLFERHEVEKRYLALSNRKPKKKQGTIKGGMKPSRRGQWMLTKNAENFAVTQFFSSSFQGFRVFLLRPLTGKTHQIRVALKSLGAPIFGDVRYGGDRADRGYLHAYALQFDWQGEAKRFIDLPFEGECFSAELVDFISAQFDESLLTWPSSKSL